MLEAIQLVSGTDRFKAIILGVPLWLSRLRIQCCHCCGASSIPGWGTLHVRGTAKKKKKKKKNHHSRTHMVYLCTLVLASESATNIVKDSKHKTLFMII